MRLFLALAALAVFAPMVAASPALAEGPYEATFEELNALNDRFNEAAASYDLEAFLSLYDDETLWIAPATPPVAGHDAPSQTFQFLADNQGKLTHDVDKLFVSDDGTLAVMIGTADVLVESQGMDVEGTYLFVLERQDEGWKIVTDMWHQHQEAQQ